MKNMLYEAAWKADNNDGEFDRRRSRHVQVLLRQRRLLRRRRRHADPGAASPWPASIALSRIWRDLRVDRVSGGTDEMMILTASKFDLKKYRLTHAA